MRQSLFLVMGILVLNTGPAEARPAPVGSQPAAARQTARPDPLRRLSVAVQRGVARCAGTVRRGACWVGSRLAPVRGGLARGARWTGRRLKKLLPVGLGAGLVLGSAGAAKAAGVGTTLAAMTGGELALLAGGATAVVGAGVGGYLYHRGRRGDRIWTASESRDLMQQVEGANDPERIDMLLTRARRARHTARAEQSQAETSGSRKARREARRNAAFSGLAATYAELLLNGASSHERQRVGGRTPRAWQERFGALEQEALARGFDGKVALELEALRAEVAGQDGAREKQAAAIQAFKKQTPWLFARKMKADLARVSAAAGRFGQEGQLEAQLAESKTSAMRGRVSDRLAGADGEYRGHRQRLTTLDGLYTNKLQPAVTLVKEISEALDTVHSARNAQAANLALAASKTHVYVGKDEKGRSKYEDKSGFYRGLAAAESARAHRAASTARDKTAELNTHLERLRNDPDVRGEGLAVPGAGARAPTGGGLDPLSTYFAPPGAALAGNLVGNLVGFIADNSSGARKGFASVKQGVEQMASVVDGRRQQERSWVDGRIDRRLQTEMAQARQGALSPR